MEPSLYMPNNVLPLFYIDNMLLAYTTRSFFWPAPANGFRSCWDEAFPETSR